MPKQSPLVIVDLLRYHTTSATFGGRAEVSSSFKTRIPRVPHLFPAPPAGKFLSVKLCDGAGLACPITSQSARSSFSGGFFRRSGKPPNHYEAQNCGFLGRSYHNSESGYLVPLSQGENGQKPLGRTSLYEEDPVFKRLWQVSACRQSP